MSKESLSLKDKLEIYDDLVNNLFEFGESVIQWLRSKWTEDLDLQDAVIANKNMILLKVWEYASDAEIYIRIPSEVFVNENLEEYLSEREDDIVKKINLTKMRIEKMVDEQMCSQFDVNNVFTIEM